MILSQITPIMVTQAEREVFQGRQKLIGIPGFRYHPPPEQKSGRDEHKSEVVGRLQFLSGRGSDLCLVIGQWHSIISIEQNQDDYIQETFHEACAFGNEECVKRLLATGAIDVNTYD
jgi:hypothetical protein